MKLNDLMKSLAQKMVATLIVVGVASPCFADDENQRKRVITPIAWITIPQQETAVYGLRAGVFLRGSLNYLDAERDLRTDVYGLSLGVLDMGDNSVTGIQFSGLCGIVNNLQGMQCSGFLNCALEEATGLQCAVWMNGADYMSGVQIAGLVNRAEDMNGVQMASGNVAINIKGIQFGVVNYTKNMSGVQLGLVNLAKENMHGVQLGVYNSAGGLKGVQIGIVNFNGSRCFPGLMIGW